MGSDSSPSPTHRGAARLPPPLRYHSEEKDQPAKGHAQLAPACLLAAKARQAKLIDHDEPFVGPLTAARERELDPDEPFIGHLLPESPVRAAARERELIGPMPKASAPASLPAATMRQPQLIDPDEPLVGPLPAARERKLDPDEPFIGPLLPESPVHAAPREMELIGSMPKPSAPASLPAATVRQSQLIDPDDPLIGPLPAARERKLAPDEPFIGPLLPESPVRAAAREMELIGPMPKPSAPASLPAATVRQSQLIDPHEPFIGPLAARERKLDPDELFTGPLLPESPVRAAARERELTISMPKLSAPASLPAATARQAQIIDPHEPFIGPLLPESPVCPAARERELIGPMPKPSAPASLPAATVRQSQVIDPDEPFIGPLPAARERKLNPDEPFIGPLLPESPVRDAAKGRKLIGPMLKPSPPQRKAEKTGSSCGVRSGKKADTIPSPSASLPAGTEPVDPSPTHSRGKCTTKSDYLREDPKDDFYYGNYRDYCDGYADSD